MPEPASRMTFHVESHRVDSHGSLSRCKNAKIFLDTDESEQRLSLLHENLKRFGTVFNTVAHGPDLSGVLRRR